MRIFNNVILGNCGRIHIIGKLDPADLLKHQIASCGVGGIVRNCNLRTVRDLINRCVFCRIYASRYSRDRADRHKIRIVVCVEVLSVCGVLLHVDINIAVV